jgi:hypothetical protein
VGAHDFAVRALDALGNADATPATRSWTIDPPAAAAARAGTWRHGPAAASSRPPGPRSSSSSAAAGRSASRAKKPRLTLVRDLQRQLLHEAVGRRSRSLAARAAGLSKSQARAKKLKLRAKTYTLAGTKTTRVVLAIPRRLARQILAGLKQRRRPRSP